jgi:FkbM family methyltransferase
LEPPSSAGNNSSEYIGLISTLQAEKSQLNTVMRILSEYSALGRVLEPKHFLSLATATAVNAPEIVRSRKLTALDAAMSRNMTVRFGKSRVALPLADIDQILSAHRDNPTFGNLREIYARNCYLHRLKLNTPIGFVLDLGANRGMFSVLALVALGADKAIGVEPLPVYQPVAKLLLEANHCSPDRAVRYGKFISSPSVERRDPGNNVSIQTILREQGVDRFQLVKMDIEGHEKEVFGEPEWLASVDNITMELHPQTAGDLSVIPQALERHGFRYLIVDQAGNPTNIHNGMFLYASCTGALQ